MKTTQKQRIIKHGEDLNRIFDTGIDPLILCKKLHSIEKRMHKNAEKYCNGEINYQAYEKMENRALDAIDNIIHYKSKNIPVFINSDPRGYALKINDTYVQQHNLTIDRDWGGYGLIAPEIN